MEDNELVQRLSTMAGIIMEDMSPTAVSHLPSEPTDVQAMLTNLEQAMQDAATLLQAAQVLVRRELR